MYSHYAEEAKRVSGVLRDVTVPYVPVKAIKFPSG